MSNFHKHIVVGGKAYEFSFQLVYGPIHDKYFIKTQQSEAEYVAFEMKKESYGVWKIIQPAPSWIREIEEQLSDAIKHHEENNEIE